METQVSRIYNTRRQPEYRLFLLEKKIKFFAPSEFCYNFTLGVFLNHQNIQKLLAEPEEMPFLLAILHQILLAASHRDSPYKIAEQSLTTPWILSESKLKYYLQALECPYSTH